MAKSEPEFRGDFQAEDFERTAQGRVALSKLRRAQLAKLQDLQSQIDRVAADLSVLDIEGGEAVAAHGDLTGIGTNTHPQIDTHIADATKHFTEGSIDHTAIANIGSTSHADLDTHVGDATLHFTEGSIDHTAISNVGSTSHADIDTHIGDATLHFTEGSISHTNIGDIGTNTHAQVDSHIADSTLHFTEGSIDHTAIANIGTNTHAQIDTHISTAADHIADSSIHTEEATLLARANHTGTQNLATISDSGALAALDTVDAAQIDDEAVTLAKMADMATDSLLGRDTAGTGVPEVLSASVARGILNVEDGATADQTGAQIKSAYEGEADTNAFTDADHTKLDGIEASATADQTDAEIYTAWENDHKGASFPGSPSSGDTFYRTDLLCEFQYTGSAWLSTHEIAIPFTKNGSWASTQYLPMGGMNPNAITEGFYSPYTYTLSAISLASATTTTAGDRLFIREGTTNQYTWVLTAGVRVQAITDLEVDLGTTYPISVYANTLSSSLTDPCVTIFLRRRAT